MNGLENKSDEVIIFCITNLKNGILMVDAMDPETRAFSNGHDLPAFEAVNQNHMFLDMFVSEAFRRGIDPDKIVPEANELHEIWLESKV